MHLKDVGADSHQHQGRSLKQMLHPKEKEGLEIPYKIRNFKTYDLTLKNNE